MKKYKLILPIVLSFFIVGCNNNEIKIQNVSPTKDTSTSTKSIEEKNNINKTEDKQESSTSNGKIFIDVKTVNQTSTFSFGMSKDNVLVKLKELKLEVKSEVEITSSEDDPEWGNKVVLTDGISFSFDKSNKLYGISVTEKISTSLDLKKGDSLEKTEKLYGKSYNKYNTENGFVYEYSFKNHYFRVFVEADKISRWAVSKYKFLK